MARFLIDAQLPPGLAVRLRHAGQEASHVADHAMLDATDQSVCEKAMELGAILVSKDEDFVVMLHSGSYAGALMWVRLGNTSNRRLWEVIGPKLPEITGAFADGERLVELQ